MDNSQELRYDLDSAAEKEGSIVGLDSPDTNVKPDQDLEFGGYEERRKLEKKLLWKLDCRMSILIVIYILNYVCQPAS